MQSFKWKVLSINHRQLWDYGWGNWPGLAKGQKGTGVKRHSLLGWSNPAWFTSTHQGYAGHDLVSRRKKVVGEPYEGKPHVRFEVAGDGNQDITILGAIPWPYQQMAYRRGWFYTIWWIEGSFKRPCSRSFCLRVAAILSLSTILLATKQRKVLPTIMQKGKWATYFRLWSFHLDIQLCISYIQLTPKRALSEKLASSD